ncbi:MAG: STAS domain-containing protein [Acidobacteriota bacterium]
MTEGFRVTEAVSVGLCVLRTEGYVNNLGGEDIANRCYRLMEQGHRQFVINLSGSKVVNSIGISILIEIIEKVIEIGGRLAFCGLTPTIAKTFNIMGLAQYSSLHGTEEEAIKSMAPAGASS